MEGQDSERSCSAQFARFFGGLPGDQQVHIVHILHILYYTVYSGKYYLNINYFYSYIRSMTSSLAKDSVYVIAVMQKGMIPCQNH